MDQTSFDFIKAAMIERVKAEPIYTYWKTVAVGSFDSGHVDLNYGLLVAINLGSGFELYNLSERDIKNTFEGITVGFSPFSRTPVGVPYGLVSDEILIELHKMLREGEA
jgi:hypothetical protein